MNVVIIMKYLVSGGIAAVVNLSFLFLFTDVFRLWYILSASIAFVITFFVSFYLQRSWTFKNTSSGMVRVQIVRYFVTAIWNILINIFILYVLVEYIQLHYLFAQFIALALIAVESFFIYRLLIFTSRA